MSAFLHKITFFGTILLLAFAQSTAYKILGILPTAARSHQIVGSALMKGLALKGHEVTVISTLPQKHKLKNYHDIALPENAKIMENHIVNLFDWIDRSPVEVITIIHSIGLKLSRGLLEEPAVQALLQSNQTFDAVICEVCLSESLFGFSEHFNAPLIGWSPIGAHPWNTDLVGSPSPPSYVPASTLPLTDRMTLAQRLGNLVYTLLERILIDYFYLPQQEAIYKKYFPKNKRSMYDIRKNAALVLLNQHVSITSPRPYMPNQIEVGGMHINRKRTPLPADIQQFIDEAEHGVIYFSMGSNVESVHFPLEKHKIILNTFRVLKQRVLWKFEAPLLADKPDNVFISTWFPQDDILAHPNVRAFITHGGLLSIFESIYHGIPFVGIPIFGDHLLNMARAERNGYGIMLDYKNLTMENFKQAIDNILNNSTYKRRLLEMSARHHDQPMEPLDRAIYWVEHVVRQKGAEYMHCAGQDLNFIQYHSIDTILILSGIVLAVILLIVLLLKFVWHLVWSLVVSKKQQKVKSH